MSPPHRISRRSLLARGAALAAVAALPRGLSIESLREAIAAGEYLDAAKKAERWIAASAIRDAGGTTWPTDPLNPQATPVSLYSGSAGVVLFYLELFKSTGDARFLAEAEGGARYLWSTLAGREAALEAYAGEAAGLYTGLAGLVYVLDRVHLASGQAAYGEMSRNAFQVLSSLGRPTGAGVAWSESNDIISGTAGIGLTLLWGARVLGDGDAIALAKRAGDRLVEVGIPRPGGLTWEISPKVPRRYPNFSHGAAGVSYFLARLAAATNERRYLDTAIQGARYLQGVATETPGKGRMVFHSEPGNEQLYYLSWCHGPAGTARLFHQLADMTNSEEWSRSAGQLTTALFDMNVPRQSPGYWNNVSQCCGNCGVTEYFLALHDRDREAKHLEAAIQVMRDTLSRSSVDHDGLKWIQAEHRVRPELLVAQTGLMQGAAGVGLALLHVDGALSGRRPFIVLPDSPYFA
jgi:lantibiotic modifying enzyme